MNSANAWDEDGAIDRSHVPTRKVDTMSSLVAEMIVTSLDSEAIAETSKDPDAAALDVARLIEVQSQPPSSWPAPGWSVHQPVGAPRRGPRWGLILAAAAALLVVGAAVAGALVLVPR